MSRLYDRVRTLGCRPLSAGDLHQASIDDPEVLSAYKRDLAEQGDVVTDTAARRLARGTLQSARAHQANERLSSADVEGVTVIVADGVGDYVARLPPGTRLDELVSTLAPPFPRFWIESRLSQNPARLVTVGVLIEVLHGPESPNSERPDDAWALEATIVGEWRKGVPVRPIARYVIPLDARGCMHPPSDDGHGSLFGSLSAIPGMAGDEAEQWVGHFKLALLVALFAVSLMHCKNVDVVVVDPPQRLSAAHRRRHGVELVRYHELVIDPMRRVLDAEGGAQTHGLRYALHICRGHFKTYSADLPLFGRLTGTYWWADHTRGNPDAGVVEKDYRIRLDSHGLGRDYEPVDEQMRSMVTQETRGRDPDLAGRGLAAHNRTRNRLAAAVEPSGHVPRRPRPDEPQYDVAWDDGHAVWVCEVKSLTPANEERQLRLALGQVLRYQQLLDGGTRPVRAVIAVERPPGDDEWLELATRQGVALIWPEIFGRFLSV